MKKRYNPELNKKKLLEALERNLGIVTAACKEVGLSRSQFYEYYRTDEDFAKKSDDINEVTLDFAESQLLKKIKEGSERSILFYMKYKARKRGYTENIDITTNGENINNIQIEIIKKKDDDINE
jgi:ACT domain-containing protein